MNTLQFSFWRQVVWNWSQNWKVICESGLCWKGKLLVDAWFLILCLQKEISNELMFINLSIKIITITISEFEISHPLTTDIQYIHQITLRLPPCFSLYVANKLSFSDF